jgi:hypothetical protein
MTGAYTGQFVLTSYLQLKVRMSGTTGIRPFFSVQGENHGGVPTLAGY